jgi:2-oxoglutarate dehydrogenase E2 component (dihydrolipoamide succinyltransferase)
VNAYIDGDDVVYHNYIDMGIAVSTENGLIVPVLRDAGIKSFAEIEQGIIGLATKARDGGLKPDDLQGGTFSITNGGIFGSMLSTPILNTPQSAILGMHTIQQRAVVEENTIVARPMMYLALSYDHRLIDGKDAVQFLVRVKSLLESPEYFDLSL